MRTFIAISISDELTRKIQEIQRELKTGIPTGVNWSSIASIHLTLKFIGEIDQHKVHEIHSNLLPICESMDPIEIIAKGLGCFPSIRHPRVIWMGLEKNERMSNLAMLIDDLCAEYGIRKENRIFSPHLTLGRVKTEIPTSGGLFLKERIQSEREKIYSSFFANEIKIYKSELHPAGAIYTPVAICRLKK